MPGIPLANRTGQSFAASVASTRQSKRAPTMWSFPSFFPDMLQPAAINYSLNLHRQRSRAPDDPKLIETDRNSRID
jgi:hypothetical protein